jgi:anti-anti-sigma factor
MADGGVGTLRLSSRALPDGITVIEVSGDLNGGTARELRERIADTVANGEVRLIVDLTNVDHLDTAGQGVLVGARKRTEGHGGAVVVVCAEERLLRTFRITGLNRFFLIAPDVASARLAHVNGTIPAHEQPATGSPAGVVAGIAIVLTAAAATGAILYWLRRRGRQPIG